MRTSTAKEITLLKQKLARQKKRLNKIQKETKKATEQKTQFLANMSHEIRSPLNGIIGMLNLLKSQKFTAQQQEYIEIAENSADHLMSLVNMILDHSKLKSKKIVLEKYPLNLKQELNKLIRLFEYRAFDKNIKLNFIFDPKIEPHVLADNIRLQQVLINLLDNAIKFTLVGNVNIQVELISKTQNDQNVKFKIVDSGIGIKEDKVEKILKAFEQADPTITRQYGGTGLGLTISNQIIQMMRGKLNIVSSPENGSCFCFEIPLEIDKSKSLGIEKEVSKIKVPTDYNRSKVLIAEDNKINQKVLINFLKKLNIEADIADDGLKAVDYFINNEYDMIFMDIHMPNMDGYSATETIKSLEKYKENPLPIIAVTASAFDEDKVKALSCGMHDFIAKPVIFNKLQETIFKHMSDEFKTSISA